jgi:hypothetical protein
VITIDGVEYNPEDLSDELSTWSLRSKTLTISSDTYAFKSIS